ncbi:Protein kinase superfamily protein [Trifolium repens]|nr:Protein kinase superfamily protein [Trifolium repens]
MQNGSLETQLHGPSHGSPLTWHMRMKIALDTTRDLKGLLKEISTKWYSEYLTSIRTRSSTLGGEDYIAYEARLDNAIQGLLTSDTATKNELCLSDSEL